MNYRQTFYRLPAYAAIATTLIGGAGCATRGSVSELSQRLSGLEGRMPPVERKVDDLGTKVGNLEKKPNAERPIMVKKGKSADELYGWLRGQVLPQYQNADARKDAESNANAITLVPTGLPNVYYAIVMQDAEGDGVPSKGDYTFPDIVDGKQRIQFVIDKSKLPEALRYQLLNVMGLKGK